jgi:hypothetical protein
MQGQLRGLWQLLSQEKKGFTPYSRKVFKPQPGNSQIISKGRKGSKKQCGFQRLRKRTSSIQINSW